MKWVFLLALACKGDEPRVQIDLTREHDSAGTYAGVSFTFVYELSADERSPVLVMLHGRGDSARTFRDAWPAFPVKLQLSFPQAPLPLPSGRQWFEWSPGDADDALARAVTVAEAKLWPAIVEVAHGRQILVGGFSQGATVAYAMAMRHPDEIAGAFLIAGRMPARLRGTRAAPIVVLQGTSDDRVSIDDTRARVAALQAAGLDATLFEYPGVGHTIAPPMFNQLVTSVRARLRLATRPP